MKYKLLDYLICPDCGGALEIRVFQEERVDQFIDEGVKACHHGCALKQKVRAKQNDDMDCQECFRFEIKEGVLVCEHEHTFPIVDCIPRMLPDAFVGLNGFVNKYKHLLPIKQIEKRITSGEVNEMMRIQKNTKLSFGYQWLRYNVDLGEEDRAVFFSDSQFSESLLREKIILDAGCGMGRYTRIAGQMGREIIGIDLSPSVLKAYQVTQKNPFAHIVQGDISRLPFREKQFDIIYSLGVLHHTPDAKRSFMNLTRYLKEGGFISIWVYGTAGKYQTFKTNPLREDRQKYIKSEFQKKLYWTTVCLREKTLNGVRLFTTRIPVPLLYCICYPLAVIGKIPLLKYLTASVHPDWKVRLQENFDWFSPPYQSHHTKEEVLSWFHEAKLDDLSTFRHGFIPKVGLRGRFERVK